MKIKLKNIIMLLFIVICLPFVLVGCVNNKNSIDNAPKYDSDIENFTFHKTEDNTGYILNSYNGNSDYVQIPEKYNNLPVKEIGEKAFYQLKVYKVIIPDTIEIIGDEVFSGCSNLIELELPAKLEAIGNSTFLNCSRLTNIIIPDSTKEIGNAFANCRRLTSLVIGCNMRSIGTNAFSYCQKLTNVIIKSETIFLGLTNDTNGGLLSPAPNTTPIIKVDASITVTPPNFLQANYTETIAEGYRVFTKNV